MFLNIFGLTTVASNWKSFLSKLPHPLLKRLVSLKQILPASMQSMFDQIIQNSFVRHIENYFYDPIDFVKIIQEEGGLD